MAYPSAAGVIQLQPVQVQPSDKTPLPQCSAIFKWPMDILPAIFAKTADLKYSKHVAKPKSNQQQWMQAPQIPIGCPPGLEYLHQIDQLLCQQVVELLEAFTSWETNNRFVIKNTLGQQVYYAFEETAVCMRQCCGKQRGFTIKIVDNFQKEVIRVTRPFKCCAGCCWCAGMCDCCAHEVQIEAPPGQIIGVVKQVGSGCGFFYEICDAGGVSHLKIEGPCCTCRCCADVEFPVLSNDGRKVGKVSKQWSGFVKETFTDADCFGVSFPMDLDVKLKATLLGAMFLIDFMAFEDTGGDDN